VARHPALWPQQVALMQPTAFPLKLNGRVVGETKAPAGAPLRVVRISGQQVEVEFQTARHFIPVAATDLMQRALVTFRKNGSVLPASAPMTTPAPIVASAATPEPRPAAANAAKIGERIGVEVVRMKRSRTEGGDFDDKRDRVELRVKLINTDVRLSADKFSGEIVMLGESTVDRTAMKVLGLDRFDFSLPPRGTHEFVTPEVVTMYDESRFARFGHKYVGWVLRLKDSSGNVVVTKSTSPTLAKAMEQATDLAKDKTYDRTTFKEKAEAR
jgi:hypothetical protein